MGIWFKDKVNTLVISWSTSSTDVNLKGYCKSLTSNNDWVEMGAIENIDAGIYTLDHIFVAADNYLIKITDLNNDVSIYEKILVKDSVLTEVDLDKLNEIHSKSVFT